MKPRSEQTLEELLISDGAPCDCGREHRAGLSYVRVGRNAIQKLPDALAAIGCKHPFIVYDRQTAQAAMPLVTRVLTAAGLAFASYCFPMAHPEPDEYAVGCLCMALDPSCDGILAVGSGVINDCCKVLAHTARLPQAVVATAPSMDGYASNSASMIRARVKVTLYNACPGAIIADTAVLKDAPARMLWAGLGDMLAKYVALCEWRISTLVTGEYYCTDIAALMRASLRKIVAGAPRLMSRDPAQIGNVTEGLILSGMAMAYAQVSRPASGLEHYFSHLWEMFALERGVPMALHGEQVGVGTLLTLRVYDRLRGLTPSRAVAEKAMRTFAPAAWEQRVRRVFGGAAQTLIDCENTQWHKNDPAGHAHRLARILTHWDAIQDIIREELPATADIEALMRQVGMPVTPAELGVSEADVRDAFVCSRDIRDKYLTSSLLWDLGLLDHFPIG